MKRHFPLFVTLAALCLLSACKTGNNKTALPKADEDAVRAQLSSMTLREKVGQLFCVRPESLDPVFRNSSEGMMAYQMQAVNEETKAFAAQYPVGGVTLFSHNIDNPEQLKAFTQALHALPGAPLVSVDEEGGRVARVGGNLNFDVPRIPAMGKVGATGDPAQAYEAGKAIGHYLKEYGFDIDFAPVADVNTNPQNIVIGDRAFSSDPKIAAPMVVNYMKGLHEEGVAACIKHFPGHGDTSGDSHKGYVETSKTWEELLNCEMVTFKAAIKAGAPLIMTAHVSLPNVIGDKTPGTLSSLILTDKLRKELGYKGIIITDAMGMGAISQHYDKAQSAVMCLKAGADIVLMPEDLPLAFEAVVKAVEDGTLSEERIDESVRRVLALKQSLGR
ncbi:MAG: glycoside hydrolase [Bacteroidales bacterium]|nr:glycoside hydrolase [Bacteroidales bacterium]MBR1782387.1 glycoside hydrolase [Bacteroidales bacterium]